MRTGCYKNVDPPFKENQSILGTSVIPFTVISEHLTIIHLFFPATSLLLLPQDRGGGEAGDTGGEKGDPSGVRESY